MTPPSLTTHAKVIPSLVRMPGLFLVTPSGARRPFDVTLETQDMIWRLVGSEQLSVGDLEVLLCLIALAGTQSDESYRTTKRYTGRDSVTLGQLATAELLHGRSRLALSLARRR